jgi:hypothetical protein
LGSVHGREIEMATDKWEIDEKRWKQISWVLDFILSYPTTAHDVQESKKRPNLSQQEESKEKYIQARLFELP